MFEHSDAYEEPNDSSDHQYIGSNHHGYENVLTIRNESSQDELYSEIFSDSLERTTYSTTGNLFDLGRKQNNPREVIATFANHISLIDESTLLSCQHVLR